MPRVDCPSPCRATHTPAVGRSCARWRNNGLTRSRTASHAGPAPRFPLHWLPAARLHIGESCWFNDGCHLDLSSTIHIGNRVSFGHQVLLMTSTHEIGSFTRRAGALVTSPIHIGDGAWLGTRSTIFPGITIGDGAVVAAGAIVIKDVLPNTVVGGVPAKIIRSLPG